MLPNLKCLCFAFLNLLLVCMLKIGQCKSWISVVQSRMFMLCDRIRWEGWLEPERENIVDLSSFYPQHVTTAQCRKYLRCLWPMQISCLQTWSKSSYNQSPPSKTSDAWHQNPLCYSGVIRDIFAAVHLISAEELVELHIWTIHRRKDIYQIACQDWVTPIHNICR